MVDDVVSNFDPSDAQLVPKTATSLTLTDAKLSSVAPLITANADNTFGDGIQVVGTAEVVATESDPAIPSKTPIKEVRLELNSTKKC